MTQPAGSSAAFALRALQKTDKSPIPDNGPRKSSQLHEKRPRAVLEVNWQGMMGATVQRIWRTIKKRRFAGSGCPPPAHPYPGLKLCGRPLSVSPPLSLLQAQVRKRGRRRRERRSSGKPDRSAGGRASLVGGNAETERVFCVFRRGKRRSEAAAGMRVSSSTAPEARVVCA